MDSVKLELPRDTAGSMYTILEGLYCPEIENSIHSSDSSCKWRVGEGLAGHQGRRSVSGKSPRRVCLSSLRGGGQRAENGLQTITYGLSNTKEYGNRGLLLASISSARSDSGDPKAKTSGVGEIGLEARGNALAGAQSMRSKMIKRDALDHAIESHALHGGELEKATSEIQRVAAFMGGLLFAGISKAKQHVEKSRKHLVNASFSESFSFPWKPQHHEKETKKGSTELASNLAARGMEYERALDVRAAVQCFEEAVKLHPDDLLCLCMAAKQWSDLTFYHDVASERERQVVNMKALEYAERAIAAHPSSPGGYLALCIAKGRLGLFVDNKLKVKLAKEAQEAANAAIALGPDNDVAHHLMGRWHYEMSKLNVVVRTIVRVMYGTSLAPGNKEDALKSYQKAIDLAPDRLIHYVETGRVLLELGKREDAKHYLELAMKKDIEDINAWQTKFDAEELLAQLENRRYSRPSMIPPGMKATVPRALSTASLLGVPETTLHGGSN